jgi:hypothetical protein
MTRTLRAFLLLSLLLSVPALAQDDGTVQIPVERYDTLVDQASQPDRIPPDAPGAYALGQATARATVSTSGETASALVQLSLTVQVLEDGWVGVPLLPPDAAVSESSVNGSSMQLVPGHGALLWGVNKKGSYSIHLTYTVDARSFDSGRSLMIPLPRTATQLTAALPWTGLDVAAIPSSGLSSVESGGKTSVSATVPPSAGVQLSWLTPREQGVTISRATYKGLLDGDAISWTATYGVEVTGDGGAVLPLLPADVVLVELRVDGDQAPISVVDGRFGTRVSGGGDHTVSATFRVPVRSGEGPAGVQLRVPAVPVSRFDLDLPGDLKVTAEPGTGLRLRKSGGRTVASVNVPMTSQVAFSWSEAIPEEVSEEVRANASIYHSVHAEEGVLYVRAFVAMEVTRGATNRFELAIPAGVNVNSILADGGGVADWRVTRSSPDKAGVATIFLDREVEQEFLFEVSYEKLVGSGGEAGQSISVPLLSAPQVHRQRGMVALLASKELTLNPLSEDGLNRVGENQLPAFIRDSVDKTIAHTFKYVEAPPILAVEATTPEREDGRFDARVDTLISLSDVALQGSATVEINVKSGSLMRLRLTLPEGVNVGSLSAPSMRDFELTTIPTGTAIDVDFTQDLEGQFRVELAYEKLLGDAGGELVVPTLAVVGAEVEQGRIAVEALSAVEVQAATTTQLSTVDVTELPRQLVLRTTNPILLAYKYVQVDPPYALGLKVTRHREVDVQAATIDEATYKTLFTADGLAVTTATFMVRNRREQFLRVRLPKGSEIWSASVNGESEKPAIADDESGTPEVLIGIINSDDGFPVELVYATPVAPMRLFGRVRTELPHPHLVATRTQLDVLLPDTLRYGKASGDMTLTVANMWVGNAFDGSEGEAQAMASGPFRITVPESGIRYSFSKLYANQRAGKVQVSITYSTPAGKALASLLGLLGAVGFWVLVLFALWHGLRWPGTRLVAGAALAAAIAIFSVAWLPGSGAGLVVATVVGLAVPMGRGLLALYRRMKASGGEDEVSDEVDHEREDEVEVEHERDHEREVEVDHEDEDEDEVEGDDEDEPAAEPGAQDVPEPGATGPAEDSDPDQTNS